MVKNWFLITVDENKKFKYNEEKMNILCEIGCVIEDYFLSKEFKNDCNKLFKSKAMQFKQMLEGSKTEIPYFMVKNIALALTTKTDQQIVSKCLEKNYKEEDIKKAVEIFCFYYYDNIQYDVLWSLRERIFRKKINEKVVDFYVSNVMEKERKLIKNFLSTSNVVRETEERLAKKEIIVKLSLGKMLSEIKDGINRVLNRNGKDWNLYFGGVEDRFLLNCIRLMNQHNVPEINKSTAETMWSVYLLGKNLPLTLMYLIEGFRDNFDYQTLELEDERNIFRSILCIDKKQEKEFQACLDTIWKIRDIAKENERKRLNKIQIPSIKQNHINYIKDAYERLSLTPEKIKQVENFVDIVKSLFGKLCVNTHRTQSIALLESEISQILEMFPNRKREIKEFVQVVIQ